MRNVDQGAVKVVFDLIENNDEFSEVCLPCFSHYTYADMTRFLLKLWSY
jgi:hypothetical protein